MSNPSKTATPIPDGLNPDLLLFTDGSGHRDGFGGWCAVARTPDKRFGYTQFGCASGTSVDRMEMTAFLEGLTMLSTAIKGLPTLTPNPNRIRGPIVFWYSDRESLVLSVRGKYARSNSPDLWARFEYYEKQFDIYPFHVSRETDFAEFRDADLHASSLRIVIKHYTESST